MTTRYNAFACPKCLRVATMPWPEAFCAHEPIVHPQAFDPRREEHGSSEMDWTQMVMFDPTRLRNYVNAEELFGRLPVELPEASRAFLDEEKGSDEAA